MRAKRPSRDEYLAISYSVVTFANYTSAHSLARFGPSSKHRLPANRAEAKCGHCSDHFAELYVFLDEPRICECSGSGWAGVHESGSLNIVTASKPSPWALFWSPKGV